MLNTHKDILDRTRDSNPEPSRREANFLTTTQVGRHINIIASTKWVEMGDPSKN